MPRPIVRHQGRVRLYEGDSRDVLKELEDCSIDSVVCDPPYALVSVIQRFGGDNAAPAKYGTDGLYARASAGFMGQKWDTGETAFAETFWQEVLRVLKPGGHVVAFGGTRTYHHLAMAIELAGFEIRDQLAWTYGTGFPKSHPVGPAIDKHLGAEPVVLSERETGWAGTLGGQAALGGVSGADVRREFGPATEEAGPWYGWGTALKPAWEPICLARKPLSEKTVAANVLRWGTGALNIDACRVATEGETFRAPQSNPAKREGEVGSDLGFTGNDVEKFQAAQRASTERLAEMGRFPANLLHDGSPEVLDFFPDDAGRFFYSPKASKADREDGLEHLPIPEGKNRRNIHPTVKPTPVMEWVSKLVTPPGGVVLDPFMGSGSTGKACMLAGFRFIGIDAQPEFLPIAEARIAHAAALHTPAPAPVPQLEYDGY